VFSFHHKQNTKKQTHTHKSDKREGGREGWVKEGDTKGIIPRPIFDVLTALKMSKFIFWVATPCGLVGRHQRFGGIYCLCLQGYSIV
jgi:hypothetical protein